MTRLTGTCETDLAQFGEDEFEKAENYFPGEAHSHLHYLKNSETANDIQFSGTRAGSWVKFLK